MNDGINPEADAPQEEAPEAQQVIQQPDTLKGDEPVCEIVATFDRHSPHIQLNIRGVEPTQIWSLVGLLSFYAEQMYAQQVALAEQARMQRIQPVAAIPQSLNRAQRRRGN